MSYSDEVLADSPLAYWKLDETSGTTAADSAGSNTGTYTLPTLGVSPCITTGNAVKFESSTSIVTLASNAVATSVDDFTLEAWVYIPTGFADVGTPYIISFGDFLLYMQTWVPSVAFSSFEYPESTTPFTLDTPHHIVLTRTGVNLKFYIDGALDTTYTGSNAGSWAITGSARYLGNDLFSDQLQDIALDEVAVYDTCLSPTRVGVHYTAGTTSGPTDIEGTDSPTVSVSDIAGINDLVFPSASDTLSVSVTDTATPRHLVATDTLTVSVTLSSGASADGTIATRVASPYLG